MVAVIKKGTTQQQMEHLISWLSARGLEINITKGENYTVLGLIGDTRVIDMELLASLDIVDSVKRISEPFKQCSRHFHPENTVVDVGGVKIGDRSLCLIAGPCSVETKEQIIDVARRVKDGGAQILRGGAFKPRTSPYDFQGLGAEGVELLLEAKKATGLPIVTEIMNINQMPLFAEVDMIQIGARNMQNFDLLKAVGKTNKPILLKRGLSSTLKEWLMSAEYIISEGNRNIVLCERGIRTFDTYSRNTLDLTAVPMVKEISHLPIVVDPSHATGSVKLVPPMALAAVAAGADGVMIEVHNDPLHALCDGAQSLRPEQFEQLANKMNRLHEGIKSN